MNNYGGMGERQQENVSSILSATSTTSAAQPLVPRQVGEFSTASSSTATCMNTTSGTPSSHLINCPRCFLAIILLEEHLMFMCLPPRRLHPAH